MIRVKKNLYFMPSRLVLLEGEDITDSVAEEVLNKDLADFKEMETPRDIMARMQGDERIDYSYCFPITGGICVSEKCQLRCNYCAFDSKEEGLSVVAMEQVRPFVDFLVSNLIMRRLVEPYDNEVLDLYLAGGGEPTYEWKILVEIVEYVKKVCSRQKISYTFGITTNCILNLKQLEYIRTNFNLITVSFDGLPHLQDQNRIFSNGKGTFEIVGRSLKYFSETNTPVVMRSTIWPDDYHKLRDIAEFVFDNYPNITVLDVEPINNRGRATNCKSNTLEDDFVDYYIEAKKYLSSRGLEDKLVCGKFKDNVASFICGTSYGKNPWLLPNGNIVTCIDAKESAAVVANVLNGCIKKNTFSDNILDMYLDKRKECSDCYAFKFCGGGCPLRYVNSEEEKNNEIECAMIKKYWLYIFDNLINDRNTLGWESRPIDVHNSQIKARQIWRKTWKSELT